MNEGQFLISIKNSIVFLKKINLFKDTGKKPIGQYSNEIKKVSKSNKHYEIYKCAIKNFDYELLLNDDSIFQFSFTEDEIRFAFIQNPQYFVSKIDYITYILSTEELNEVENLDSYLDMINEDEYEQFLNEQELNSLSNFIRYDASLLGYSPLIHSFSHLHIGLNSNLRIPISIILTPLTFVKFCVKNTYNKNWKDAFSLYENFPILIKVSKEACPSIDNTKWSKIEEAELYLK